MVKLLVDKPNCPARDVTSIQGALHRIGGAALAKYIPLTRGFRALVDDDLYAGLSAHKWSAAIREDAVYASRTEYDNGNRRMIYMHREILGLSQGDGRQADHKNGNGLDNRRENLRACEQFKNVVNQGPRRSSRSGYRGVWWSQRDSKWTAQIRVDGRRMYAGSSESRTEAVLMRDVVALREHGEFAWLNFPAEIIEALDQALG